MVRAALSRRICQSNRDLMWFRREVGGAFDDNEGARPFVMPWIAWFPDGGEEFEGYEPAKAAQEGQLWGELMAVCCDHAGSGKPFSQCFAFGEGFQGGEVHQEEKAGHQQQFELYDRLIPGSCVQDAEDRPGEQGQKDPPEAIESKSIDQVVAKALVLARLGISVINIVEQVRALLRAFG